MGTLDTTKERERSPWQLNPDRALALDEAQRVFAIATGWAMRGRSSGAFRRARDGHLVLFGLATGGRVSELIAVTVDDVTFHSRGATVAMLRLKARGSTKERRTDVPIASKDADDLREWIAWLEARGAAGAFPLFPKDKPGGRGDGGTTHLTRWGARGAVQRIYEEAGIRRKGLGPHGLRHAVGGVTREVTGDARAVQGRLRHSSESTSEQYSRLTGDGIAGAAEASRAYLEGSPVVTPPVVAQLALPVAPPKPPVFVVTCRACGVKWSSRQEPVDEACECGSVALAWRLAA